MNVNKKHKNSVFSALFGTPESLRELYSAVEGVDIPPEAVIKINTLSDVVFMEQINDISFTIDDRIVVLVEHQSTINDNMPIRFLMYAARVYEKIIDSKKKYQRKQIKIPVPEFIILYNGIDSFPDYKELKLSDAFMDINCLKSSKTSVFPLELVVKLYNINHGRNLEILGKCDNLKSYSIFIEKLQENKKIKTLEEALKDTIKYCIGNNILEGFLKKHSSEVFNMLLTEWNLDDAIAANREEAWEEGMEKGREEILNLMSLGLSLDEIKQRLEEARAVKS